ncbi:FkbM family methyltransferase [Roseobacter sp. CCS2]|uniref:FkbM family methyltransferase n=1 Tax=Roseobacter sp. CCS2 TaxID=391593 RepID=UPI0000F3E57D|nr:FkbM family methyltransferase [Roseobacter sp. CCS2]EBA10995.1 hypothetical protein RCCS2_00899 [Roseobacter sp. CCS2]
MQTTLTNTPSRPFREGLAASRLLRSIALPLLRRIDRPVTIKNPFSGLPFHLLSYTHKGYWFYGKHRESLTMRRLSQLTRRGDKVFEVGGHIGYLTQFFAHKVGHTGQVHVFEPGQQNQQFLRKNIARCMQCVHINAAVSDQTGKAMFYEENLGGFMNSLEADFATSSDIASAQRSTLKVRARKVNTITLDAYAVAHNVWPAVLKIDVEGAELAVLRGATKVLQNVRSLMIEVSRNHHKVFDILDNLGFTLTHPDGTLVSDPMQMNGNVFATRAT